MELLNIHLEQMKIQICDILGHPLEDVQGLLTTLDNIQENIDKGLFSYTKYGNQMILALRVRELMKRLQL
jgi:hypothetical protein